MAEVVLEHISKVYSNGVQAVSDFSLQVADGELLVVVGPSGCGKTTTLRLIAGLEEPTAGIVRIGGQIVNGLQPRSRDVGMVFQRSTLYPHLSVRRNLAFGLQMRESLGWFARWLGSWLNRATAERVRQQDRRVAERVSATARLLGLDSVLERRPAQLSGGEQQRVALGRALVRQPGVFLLDEPLSHLDGRRRAELRHELHLLQRRLRATMVYVTHDQAEAMTLADRVVVMDRGAIQQVAPPMVLYEQPVNRFVAGFLGWPPMNFLDGQLTGQEGRPSFTAAGLSVTLTPALVEADGAVTGRPITLGIRPEAIRPALPGEPVDFPGMEVALLEPLGHAWLVTWRRPGLQLTARWIGKPDFGPGSTGLTFTRESAHVFDRLTGLSLRASRPAG
jgi:multiple sugar transport system ATP-binding protein